jgi:spore maturation protein CgeB
MKIVIFGLTVSSSWGNGHATLWRGLCAALGRRGHNVIFFERDTPYYAQCRDLYELPGGELILYSNWSEIRGVAARILSDADVAIVTSYCPDGIAATALALDSTAALRVFYDLDTPVTLHRLACGEAIEAIGPDGLSNFDLVLSYTGGLALDELRTRLGARAVAPLYGSVDPAIHQPVPLEDRFRGDLGYLGTHAPDRDAALRALFVEPARRLPHLRFLMAGSKYDGGFPWRPNIFFVGHLAPADHSAFYCSTRVTLNVTRQAMKQTGYCPSGRLFEAAACGVPMLSDWWEGLDKFFEPGLEILIANSTDDALAALDRSPEDLARIGQAARQRALAEHTATARAIELETILENAATPRQRYATEAI